jgi:hypothetical protein
MKSLLAPGLFALVCLLLVGCKTSSKQARLGGEPGWFADAARREREPLHYRPDPSRVNNEGGAGPALLEIATDRRAYPQPPAAKPESFGAVGTLGDRGREARARRLVR